MKNKKISLCLLLAVCIIVSLIAVLAVPSGAAVTVNEGASFSSSTYYQMKESIPEHTDHTLEVEFFLDPTTADNERPGVIIGNWHDETRDNNEWSVEIHKYGNIRLFHMNKENGAFEAIFFNPADVTTFAEENVGTPTDIRTHMGTAAEPKFAKMSVTVNTVSGEATLYINGKWIMTVGPNGSSYLDNNGNTVENAELKSSYVLGRTYTPSAKNPYHVIGGDCRNGSGDDFAGRIKNISLYADIRTEAEIKAYADATDFSIDSADANLCFAYDFTSPELKINEGYVKDLSANGIIAANPGWTATGRTFSTTDALMLTEGKKLTVMPRTYEAIIYAPSTITDSRVGVVFGNYHNGGTEGALNFEIRNTTDGVSMHIDPALQADGTTNQAAKNTTSGVSVRNNSAADYGWMHVVMVAREGKASESSTSSAGYYWEVYINGVSVKKVDQNTVVGLLSEYDMSSMQEKYKFMLGADHRGSANANARFKGTMRQLALYENALTAEEIYESYINGGGKGDSIILNYDMSSLESSDYVLDTTGNGYHMTQNGVSLGSLIGGMTFTSSDNLVLADKLDIQPLTYEATVYLPEDYADTDRGGVIFGNYQLGTIPCLNFEIYSNGNPRFYMHDDSSSYTRSSLVFEDCDIRQGGWVHLVLTQDNSGDTATFNCYINGELIETITDVNKANVTLDDTYTSQTNNFALGKDRRGGTPNYFKGNIKSLSLYSKTLTADEVKAAYENGGKGDILYYDLSAASASAGYVPDLTGNGYDATKDGIKPEGISFTDDSEYYLSKKLGDQPLTYEADIYLPKYLSRGGVIIGNYSGTSASGCINFEISSNGNPRLYIIDGGRTVRDVVFTNCDVRTGDWAHLAITHTKAPNLSTFNCYLNGELIETKTLKYSCAADMLTAEASSPFSLGHDSRNGEGQQFFKGRIKSVALYTKPLSEEEIKASYNNGVDSSLDSLMAYYDLTLEDNQGDTVSDGSGNGHHLSNIFNERSSSPTDYAYSFAVVGDTQMLTLYDSLNNTNYTSYIYDWLVENKDKKNIQLVMGMGDVTDKNTAAEWLIAQENVNKLNGKIPYTLIAGNHENPASLNPYFQNNANFTAFGDDIVYMEGTSLGNYYVRMNIEGNKYMVFGLEYGPNDAILSWVSEELEKEENEGYQAIITTHGYMYRNSTTISSNDVASSSVNNGLSIWNKLISKHDNIMMVLSGHDPACDIVIRQSESAGGNVVTEMLVDFQYMDRGVDYKSGMVAMLYFSADGKKVTVEYVSTYATLEA
ncbi:MAG: metallophosphoesterase, partial [Clostridia bacterium]|nr:metallophosphoesterase [Clostridia bacterium]